MEKANVNSEDRLTFTNEAYPKIKIYDHVMKVLGGNLDDCPRKSDVVFKVPKVLRLPLSVYKNEEGVAADIREADKTLHDHYVYSYWMTALRRLQTFKSDHEDPVDLSTRKTARSSSDSGQGDDAFETKYDLWRRLIAIVRSDSSSGCLSPVEPKHSYNLRSRKRMMECNTPSRKRIKRRRRRRHRPMVEGDTSARRCRPKPRLKLCRRFSLSFRSWRKRVRTRRSLKVYRDRPSTSSSSDPDCGTNLPIVRKVVDRERKALRLVSEGTMLNVVYHIPYKLLGFHPTTSKLPYMELSLEGIGGSLYQIGELMIFYRKVASDMCLDVIHPGSCSRVSQDLTKDSIAFLSEINTFCESLFPAAFAFLVSEGTESRKLKLWGFYKDRFVKQWQGLDLSLYLILFDGDPVAEQMKSELASYYKAICTLKVYFTQPRFPPEMFYYQENVVYLPQPQFHQNVPIRAPNPCFLTDRIEHAWNVLSHCIHPFNTTPSVLYQLPATIMPPMPDTTMTLKEMKDYKDRMYKQYTALYWKRAIENIRAEREHDGDVSEVVFDGTTRYTRGFVYRGVYSLYNESTQIEPPLVSESAMESIINLIPLRDLGFYPQRKYLPSMELSLKGLSKSVFQARENAVYYVYLLKQLINFYSMPNNEFDIESTNNCLFKFLEVTAPKLSYLFDHAFNYLKTRGEDPHKLNVLAMCHNSFVKFYERLKYVFMVLKVHGCYYTSIVNVIQDLLQFQYALLSIPEWNASLSGTGVVPEWNANFIYY